MGTAKRERQKATRQLRLEELAKQARKEKSKRFGFRIALGIAAVVALVGAIYLLGGGDDDKSVSAATTTTIASTTPTGSVPPKPVVSIPAELPTELKVTTLTEGTGVAAQVGDTIEAHYVGVSSADGVEFDSSYDRGSPISVTLGAGSVIQGWEEGLVGVKAGGQYQLDIPSEMAYGDGPLTFVVDIMSVTPAT